MKKVKTHLQNVTEKITEQFSLDLLSQVLPLILFSNFYFKMKSLRLKQFCLVIWLHLIFSNFYYTLLLAYFDTLILIFQYIHFFLFRNAEKQFVSEENDIVPGTEWERIAKLCDFNPKAKQGNKDVSRMRSLILQMKQNPIQSSA